MSPRYPREPRLRQPRIREPKSVALSPRAWRSVVVLLLAVVALMVVAVALW